MKGKLIAVGIAVLLIATAAMAFLSRSQSPPHTRTIPETAGNGTAGSLESATFGGGCFWCTEAVFQQLNGVASVKSGYSGGGKANPTYEEVCSETTGHAEVIQIAFDPSVVKYKDLLEVFFHTHDPTTLDRQGHDVGRRYRSVIFYHSDEQKRIAEQAKTALDDAHLFSQPIVTEIAPFAAFYPAEDYHQNYFLDNPSKGYCRVVIRPKLEKLQALFRDKVK